MKSAVAAALLIASQAEARSARSLQSYANIPDSPYRAVNGEPALTVCAPVLGAESGMWADLVNVEDPSQYQALLFVSSNGGTSWRDRTNGGASYSSVNYEPMTFGYASYVLFDDWARDTQDLIASTIRVLAVPNSFDLRSYNPPENQGIPAAVTNIAIASITVTRSDSIPACYEMALDSPIPDCVNCDDAPIGDGELDSGAGQNDALVGSLLTAGVVYYTVNNAM